jgi:hypothetical protein
MFVFSPFTTWFPGGATIFQLCIRRPASQPTGFSRLCRSKNSLGDELNVLKRKLFVKSKKTIDDYRFKSSILG